MNEIAIRWKLFSSPLKAIVHSFQDYLVSVEGTGFGQRSRNVSSILSKGDAMLQNLIPFLSEDKKERDYEIAQQGSD